MFSLWLLESELTSLEARNEPGVVPHMVPHSMGSKLLDYIRPKRSQTAGPEGGAAPLSSAFEPSEGYVTARAEVPERRAEVPVREGPLDYPAIATWLKACEDDLERGRDKHQYTKLAPMFAANECTRIDDITRMSTDMIKLLCTQAGFDVTFGLVNRVHQYAAEDVAHVKFKGKLSF